MEFGGSFVCYPKRGLDAEEFLFWSDICETVSYGPEVFFLMHCVGSLWLDTATAILLFCVGLILQRLSHLSKRLCELSFRRAASEL